MSKYIFYAASFDNVLNICELDTDLGKITHLRRVEHPRPAHIALSKDRLRLYIANEMNGLPGGVAAYDITDPVNPVLLSSVTPGSQGPCFIALTNDGKYLVGCSYFEGNIEVFPVNPDGSLSERCFEYRFTATGTASLPGLVDQAVPRSHCVLPVTGSSLMLVTDYSGDSLVCFAINEKGIMENISSVPFPRGDAPRHLARHPVRDDLVYMVTEFTSIVYPIRVDRETGGLTVLKGVHTLSGEKASFSSAIKLSPDGKFVYIPNRNNKNIAILSLHDNYERLEHAGVIPDAGFVRDVEFAPSADYLVTGDQDRNKIILYGVNKENGMCERLGCEIFAETPACFLFL